MSKKKCVDGYPYTNRCPAGLYFDDIHKYCTFKAEARCGPISTSKGTSTPLLKGFLNVTIKLILMQIDSSWAIHWSTHRLSWEM